MVLSSRFFGSTSLGIFLSFLYIFALSLLTISLLGAPSLSLSLSAMHFQDPSGTFPSPSFPQAWRS